MPPLKPHEITALFGTLATQRFRPAFATSVQMLVGIVVGYANDTLKELEWKSVCSQFIKIGSTDGSDMKLGELIPGGPWGYGTDLIKVFKTSSAVDFNAVYMPEWSQLTSGQQRAVKQAGWTEATWVKGWYPIVNGKNDYTASKNDTPIAAGSGFLAQSATTGATITQPSAL